ncbi:MAG TPA: PAS domain S-box protein [Ohtaekwangia sp.]|nr:PAS domain S-box protein [Ohtaekwangia sp.]
MQDILKHLPAVFYEYAIYPDGEKKFLYLSDAAEKILNIKPCEAVNDPGLMDRLIHKDDLQDLHFTSKISQQEGRDWHWQGRMLVRGEERMMEMRSNHETREDGIIIRRGIIQDVTERKELLKESELRYQTLVERLPIGIVVHNHGKLVFANAQAHVILGAQKTDLVGKHVLNFVHPDFRDGILTRLKEVASSAPAHMVEQKYVRVDGRVIDVEASAFPFIYKGAPSIQVIFRDITEKKLTEARIKKNETMFTQLFQNVPIAVVLLDENGKVNQVNQGFQLMFGYDWQELRGKNLNDYIVPDPLRNEGIDLNNLIASNKVVKIDTTRRHRDGRLVNVMLYGVPIMQENQTIGIYGVYIDITERMKVEEELKIRNAELDNFVYKVSHDLRAPLSSILGLVNLAKLPGNTDDLQEYIDIIGGKVEHLDHFIGDVLSHSKNLKMEVTISKVDFNSVIDRTFNDLNYLQGASDIRKSIRIEGIDFYSDPWRISEIFRNLISNAIKYRQIHGVQSEVSIRVHVDHLRAEINFSDNGIGIDEQNLAKIFEMFYRATEQSDGSGIGLYIVKNAVDKLGGQITVSSRLRQGTRFNIILPNRIKNIISKITPSLVEQR